MIRVATNRGLDGKFQKVKDMLEGYQEEYLRLMAGEITSNSPVDSATYVLNHHLDTMEVEQSVNSPSEKSARNQPRQPNIDRGFERLVEMIPKVKGESRVVFSNATVYEDKVEYEHGYFVYTQAAREHKRLARQAAENVRTET